MILYHATTVKRIADIRKRGLLARKARGKHKTVWLCASARIGWAIDHCARRHRQLPESVVVVEVHIPRGWLRNGRLAGLYHSGGRDVPAKQIIYGMRLKVVWEAA